MSHADQFSIEPNVTTGAGAATIPLPSGAGKVLYDTGVAYAETNAGTTSQVLVGGTTPTFGNVPAAALTSVPAGNLTGTAPLSTVTVSGSTAGQVLTSTGSASPPIWSNNAGSMVTLCSFSQGGTWTAGYYAGPFGAVENSFNGTFLPIPWVAPCAGVLKNFYMQTLYTNSTANTFTAYRAVAASPFTYNVTSVALVITGGGSQANDLTHTLTVAAGDCVNFRNSSGATFSGVGAHIVAQFEPTGV